MDRYFRIDCCVYDRDNYHLRIAYGSEETAQNVTDKLNGEDYDPGLVHGAWCGTSHLLNHGPWAPSNYYVSEYALACQILGEEYFA